MQCSAGSTSACTGATPICDTSSYTCRGCAMATQSTDCTSAGSPYCDTATGICVAGAVALTSPAAGSSTSTTNTTPTIRRNRGTWPECNRQRRRKYGLYSYCVCRWNMVVHVEHTGARYDQHRSHERRVEQRRNADRELHSQRAVRLRPGVQRRFRRVRDAGMSRKRGRGFGQRLPSRNAGMLEPRNVQCVMYDL